MARTLNNPNSKERLTEKGKLQYLHGDLRGLHSLPLPVLLTTSDTVIMQLRDLLKMTG